MTKTIGMAAATFLAVCGTFAALGDTVEEREKRTDEIAQWLPAEPKADGARIGDRAAWGRLAARPAKPNFLTRFSRSSQTASTDPAWRPSAPTSATSMPSATRRCRRSRNDAA